MFIDRSAVAEIHMLVPGTPQYSVPWRFISAAVLIFILALVASI